MHCIQKKLQLHEYMQSAFSGMHVHIPTTQSSLRDIHRFAIE